MTTAQNLGPSYIIYDPVYEAFAPDTIEVGTIVGRLKAEDPEGDPVTFKLESLHARDLYHYNDNIFKPVDDFVIVDNLLVVAEPLNTFEYGLYWQYVFRISATDSQGNTTSTSRGLTLETLRDDVKGTSKNDVLTADAGNAKKMFGYAGADRLVGGDKDDVLYGGLGKDVLAGKERTGMTRSCSKISNTARQRRRM